nr:uncharacterized protein LOC122173026 isoform X5 [Chrysemys picta bellii]
MAGAGRAAWTLLQPCSPRGVAVGPGAARSGQDPSGGQRHAWGGHGPAGRGRARLPGSPPAREVPKKHLAPLGKEREAAKAEEERHSEELLGAGSTGGREDGMFRKPEPGLMELEKRLSDFSLKSAMLQEVLLGFKETLRRGLGSDTGMCLSLTGHGEISDQ